MNLESIFQYSSIILATLIAIILHEISHAYVAEKLGDPTARKLGRITLNPFKHIDWFWTIVFPALLIFLKSPVVFGAAKPVPVNPNYFSNPRKGMLWVAVAGPITNFVLAGVSYLLLQVLQGFNSTEQSTMVLLIQIWIVSFCAYSILVNLVLGLFNLMPVPPLDGGRIITGLLPEKIAYKFASLERFGFLIVIALIYFEIPQLVLEPVIRYVSAALSN